MIVERTENPQWLSNAYLVADPERGTGVLIDGNEDVDPLIDRAEADGITITHYLVTHPHVDHVAGIKEARERLGGPPLVAHEATAAELDEDVDVIMGDGDKLDANGIEIEALYTPGHAPGHLAFLIDRSPEVHHLAVELDVHLVEVPAPMPEPAHSADPLPADVRGEQRTEAVPPMPHRLVADVDAAFEQQVLNITQRERKADIHHHHQPDHFG